MAVRTSASLLAKIIRLNPKISTADVNEFITTASMLVDSVVAVNEVPATGSAPARAYTADELEMIERWLAAHFYCIRDPRAERERVGRITFEAQSKVDLGLNVTHYGQQAMALDVAGGLRRLNQSNTSANAKTPLAAFLRFLGDRSKVED